VSDRSRVIVLGGGAAGLSAAYELTRPGLKRRRRPVTVYQCGWRLGGKGASGRGEANRIEEHGLHVWFGFYRNAFRLLGDAYAQLADGEERRFKTIEDAFRPCDQLGLIGPRGGYKPGEAPRAWDTDCFPLPAEAPFERLKGFRWIPYYFVQMMLAATSRTVPPPHPEVDVTPLHGAVETAVGQATQMATGTRVEVDPTADPSQISSDLEQRVNEIGPPPEKLDRKRMEADKGGLLEAANSFRVWEEELQRVGEELEEAKPDSDLPEMAGPDAERLDIRPPEVPRYLASLAKRVIALSAVFGFPDWARAQITGADLQRRGPFDDLNEIDLREALSGKPIPGRPLSKEAEEVFERLEAIDHWRCDSAVLNSPVVRVLYDLPFAYRGGDRGKPDVAAGMAIENILNIVARHDGTVMWKMNAGMGDVVFAPIYEALAEAPSSPRVEFDFFSAVERIVIGSGGRVEEVAIRRQVELKEGPGGYRPLVPGPLPVWPSNPLVDQLTDDSIREIAKTEARWREEGRLHEGESLFPAFEREPNPLQRPDEESLEVLKRGVDFSEVVLAIPPAAIQALARSEPGDLLNAAPDLDAMLERAFPVATQAFQAWFDIPRGPGSPPQLGWPLDCESPPNRAPVIGGYCKRFGEDPCFSPPPGSPEMFDTYCDMTHLLPEESWGAQKPPRHLAYFCRVAQMREGEGFEEADRRGRREAREFLEEHHRLAPRDRPFWAADFDPSHLTDRRPVPGSGWDRFDAQYARTNTGPSELYSTSHAGTLNQRLHAGDLRDGSGADGSRVKNLTLAGDWTYTAVNAGSVEAAVMSGIEAAAVLLGRRSKPTLELPWWREKLRFRLSTWIDNLLHGR
jgi:uncharacterized protein with NAD-binding domain and iron-sulfur cluster